MDNLHSFHSQVFAIPEIHKFVRFQLTPNREVFCPITFINVKKNKRYLISRFELKFPTDHAIKKLAHHCTVLFQYSTLNLSCNSWTFYIIFMKRYNWDSKLLTKLESAVYAMGKFMPWKVFTRMCSAPFFPFATSSKLQNWEFVAFSWNVRLTLRCFPRVSTKSQRLISTNNSPWEFIRPTNWQIL